MKKLLVVMLSLIISANVFSQIRIDKVEEDGSRFIISENANVYTAWNSAAAMNLCYTLTLNSAAL